MRSFMPEEEDLHALKLRDDLNLSVRAHQLTKCREILVERTAMKIFGTSRAVSAANSPIFIWLALLFAPITRILI